ncbi:MAG: hypothetical protein ACM31C_03140 [Acidobacteriota bacterium]
MRIVLLASILSIVAFGACSPYSPSLPAEPFLCGSADPKCPDGYTCGGTSGSGMPVCVVKTTATVDGPDMSGMCANDSMVEGSTRNDTVATAYAFPSPLPQNPFVFTNLAICPMGDKDNYSLILMSTQEIKADVAYDTWGSPLQGAILNSGGTPIKTMTPLTGQTNTIEADAANLPAGMYYIQVFGPSSSPGINNYKLTLTVM